MKKKIVCLVLVIVMLVSLTSCTNVVNTEAIIESPNTNLINFEIIDSNFYETILVDKNTKVMYCWIMSSCGGITPIYNADGSLKLYEE